MRGMRRKGGKRLDGAYATKPRFGSAPAAVPPRAPPGRPDSAKMCRRRSANRIKPRITMTYVVTERYAQHRRADVRPVDCFEPEFPRIDPDECIDARCASPNVRSRRFQEDDARRPAVQTALNAELAKVWKLIIEKKDAPRTLTNGLKSKKKHLLEKFIGCYFASLDSSLDLGGRVGGEIPRLQFHHPKLSPSGGRVLTRYD